MKKTYCYHYLFVLFLIFPFHSFSSENNNKEVVKSTCLESFNRSEEDLKRALLNLSKRAAVEELFGEIIKSSTFLKNGFLEFDDIQTFSSGLIRVKGDPKYYQGDEFGQVCVKITCYANKNDFQRFNPQKIKKKSCVAEGSVKSIKTESKNKAKREALTDFEPRLHIYDTEQIFSLLHDVNVINEEFISDASVYCTQIEATIYPIEIFSFNPPISPKKLSVSSDKNYFLFENFLTVEEGMVPQNWYCGDDLLVKFDQATKVLATSVAKDEHKFTIPNISFPNNFRLSIYANLDQSVFLDILLSNNIFSIEQSSTNGYTEYIINNSSNRIKEHFSSQKAKFSIEKKEMVFKIYVDGIKKLVSRISNFSNPEGVIFKIRNCKRGFKIYKIEGEYL